jgi:hypothetical protein
VAGVVLLLVFIGSRTVAAQSEPATIDLVVASGRPLRVALDERIRVKNVGQAVTGLVTEPVYAYDRIVIPVGAKVSGRVLRIDAASKLARARAYFGGNFSPDKLAILQFDTLLLADGQPMAIGTVVTGGISNVTRKVAAGSSARPETAEGATSGDVDPTRTSRARSDIRQRAADAMSEAKQKAHDALESVKSLRDPGQMGRLKDAAVQQLPYHPQYLAKGTVYDAALTAPISFGRAVPAIAAPAGTAPAPDSILTARLATTLDSSKTPRGTTFEAVITQTVFSADHRVILPEGTKLTGEVTLATPARRFHRNGRLRFLFQSVQVPNQTPAPLLGALHAVDVGRDDRVAVDDEGGTTVENSKTRFIAPALSLLMLRASIRGDGESHPDPDGDGSIKTAGSGAGSRGIGGFIGIGLIGAAVSQITRPVGVAMGVYGAARTTYTNILGKGREVTFPADTPIQVRLAPGPPPR